MRVKAFQGLMRDLYYHKDSKRGADKTLLWLAEEVGELSRAVRRGDVATMGEEMADIVAWVMSLANILGLDMEELLAKKYPGRCSYCGNNPCTCET